MYILHDYKSNVIYISDKQIKDSNRPHHQATKDSQLKDARGNCFCWKLFTWTPQPTLTREERTKLKTNFFVKMETEQLGGEEIWITNQIMRQMFIVLITNKYIPVKFIGFTLLKLHTQLDLI